jgi:hypothetical protein
MNNGSLVFNGYINAVRCFKAYGAIIVNAAMRFVQFAIKLGA